MLQQMLNLRKLPDLRSREQMLSLLQEQVYGNPVPKPEKLTFTTEKKLYRSFCAGNAVCNRVIASCLINGKEFSFPFFATIPTDGKKHPFFVHINFRASVPDRYEPTEELVDNGFAVLSFCYEDVTSDQNDFTHGLAGVLFENGVRKENDPGKIAMWAWAAQRLLDYAETMPEAFDLSCATVCGHSRLGKTALLAGATDPRFAFAYSNDSGCTGAAVSRGKQGETVKAICTKFPHWFCKNYTQYMDKEETMPFDQHYLVASIAPRRVLVGSASEDLWADPVSEFLCCVAAGEAFDGGFICEERLPAVGEAYLCGNIGYHLRKGTHYFSRHDWHRLMEFIRIHTC